MTAVRRAGVGTLGLAALLGAGALLSGASPNQLETRVTVLEQKVADLQSRVTRLEGGSPAPSQTPRPSTSPSVRPSVSPSPSAPTPAPSPSQLTGWTLAFSDDFTIWDPTKYSVYPSTWRDTEEQRQAGTGGFYGAPLTSNGQVLRIPLGTVNGVPRGAAFIPLPTGRLTSSGDLLSYRVEFAIRADRMPGWKGVPLGWPGSGNWPKDGELNWPESNFDQTPAAYMHYQDATVTDMQTGVRYQDWYPATSGTSWQDRHVYAMEWVAGQSVEFFLDGRSIGRSTNRVPGTAMHEVMQFETAIDGRRPDPAVSGFVELDYLRMWSP